MSKKSIKIFILAFVTVFIIILSVYLFFFTKQKKDEGGETTSIFQKFNPFGSGEITDRQTDPVIDDGKIKEVEIATSKFRKITNFAVAGATFFEDIKLINNATNEIIKIKISPETKDGRKEIQKILNEAVKPNPLLITDGVFGKSTIKVIEAFQKLNNLTIIGQIDTATAPYFTTNTKINTPQFEKVPALRYVERATGHIYQMYLDSRLINKVSNSTIPGVHEVIFDNKASSVIYRYLSEDKTINSFMATMGESRGDFLPSDILEIALSPDKNKYFYLIKNSNGVLGMIGSFGEIKKETVFNSSFTEWLLQWATDQKIFLTTKPSWSVAGGVFSLDKNTGILTKIFGKVAGLTTLVNKNGSLVLYNTSTKTGPRLEIYNIINNDSVDLNIFGLPEKCVWGNNNYVYCAIPNNIIGYQYPDSWYQGLVSFNDYFIKINALTKEIEKIANSMSEVPLDATFLFLDNNENLLFFINKKDYTLWSLDLR